MAIVYRGGRAYAYRSIRRNGRVTSEYRGSGDIVALIAVLDVEERDERDGERYQLRAEQERIEAIENTLTRYDEQVEELVRAVLYSAGFHRPKRVWRKRRERREED